MSKIEESLAKASKFREDASDDKSNQRDVYNKDRRGKQWLYVPIETVIAFVLVIMSVILFIMSVILFINTKEQAADRALIEELQATIAMLEKKLSDKNMETQVNIDSGPEEHNISENLNTQMAKNLPEELFLYSRQDDAHILTEERKVDYQFASRIIYTIQAGSLTKIVDAQKQFNSMLQSLNEKNLNLLRIEKVGEYYTVRLGKFENYIRAQKFLQKNQPQLLTAIILKAYIKNERIIKLYE
jgi:hypothetical protein